MEGRGEGKVREVNGLRGRDEGAGDGRRRGREERNEANVRGARGT